MLSNNKIKILVNQQNIYKLPSENYLHIKLEYTNGAGVYEHTLTLISNAVVFLFDVRHEINGLETDCIKNVGQTTTMENLITIKPYEINNVGNAAWSVNLIDQLPPSSKDITFCVSLRLLLGFGEEYKRLRVVRL